MTNKIIDWDYNYPHIMSLQVQHEHIDLLGHVNNVVYLSWLEKAAWSHSNHLGMDWEAYQEHGKAMVARRHELDYLMAAFEGDELELGTWIIQSDKKVSMTRAYQIVRKADKKTLLRGQTKWVCVDLKAGRASRMPQAFIDAYQVLC